MEPATIFMIVGMAHIVWGAVKGIAWRDEPVSPNELSAPQWEITGILWVIAGLIAEQP